MSKIYFTDINADNFEKLTSMFVGDENKRVAPPTDIWLKFVVNDENSIASMGLLDAQSIALIQTEGIGGNRHAISIVVGAKVRGKGLFSEIFEGFLSNYNFHGKTLVAFIEPDNLASLRAFQSVGFERASTLDEDEMHAFELNVR